MAVTTAGCDMLERRWMQRPISQSSLSPRHAVSGDERQKAALKLAKSLESNEQQHSQPRPS